MCAQVATSATPYLASKFKSLAMAKAISYARGTPLSAAPHARLYFLEGMPNFNLRKNLVSIIEYKDDGCGNIESIFKMQDRKRVKDMKAMKARNKTMKVMKTPKKAMKVMKVSKKTSTAAKTAKK